MTCFPDRVSAPANGGMSEAAYALDDLGAQLSIALVELAKTRARVMSLETYIKNNADVLGLTREGSDQEDPPDAGSNGHHAADPPLQPASVDGIPGE